MYSIEQVSRAITSSWSRDTCFARDDFIERGRVEDLSRGQCGTTALVLQDYLGGVLLVADVYREGHQDGVHYRNRLPDGSIVDLTGHQFLADETIGTFSQVERPPGPPTKGRVAYELLSDRVKRSLNDQA